MSARKVWQHEIETQSEDQFTEFIHSLKWEIDRHRRDDGEDFWVRIYEDGKFTGDVIFVQLKGTDKISKYKLKEKNVYKYPLKVVNLAQWQRTFVPVFIVLWDITSRTGYWLPIQDFINDNLATNPSWLNGKEKTRIVYIPTGQVCTNQKPESFSETVKAKCSELRQATHINRQLGQIRNVSGIDITETYEEVASFLLRPLEVQHQNQLAEYENLIASNPLDFMAWLGKSQIYYELGDMDKALTAVNKAWKIQPQNSTVSWNRACVLVEYAKSKGNKPKGMLYEAIKLFESAGQDQDSTKHYNIGNAYDALQEYTKAIKHFDIALADNPPNDLASQIWKNKGTAFYHLNNFETEILCYQKSIELEPRRWQAYSSWGATELRRGNFAEAKVLYLKALEYIPHYEPTFYAIHYSLAFTLWKLEAYVEAYNHVTKVLEHDPLHKDGISLKLHLLTQMWRDDMAYIPDAVDFFSYMLLDDPKNIFAKSELYLLQKALGNLEQAMRILEETVISEDAPPRALYEYAAMLEVSGNKKQAMIELERAAQKSQEHHIVHKLAILKQEANEFKDAIHFYELALQDASDQISILSDMADCYYSLEDYIQCIRLMLSLIKLEPDNMRFWQNLQYALVKLDQDSIAFDIEMFMKIYVGNRRKGKRLVKDIIQKVDMFLSHPDTM